jgi:hypothetical protein
MKTFTLRLIATVVLACAMATVAPNLLKNSSLAGIRPESSPARHNFYFGKRQWLADARTFMAAVSFVYRSHVGYESNGIRNTNSVPLRLTQIETSTNLIADIGGSSTLLATNHHAAEFTRRAPRAAMAPTNTAAIWSSNWRRVSEGTVLEGA